MYCICNFDFHSPHTQFLALAECNRMVSFWRRYTIWDREPGSMDGSKIQSKILNETSICALCAWNGRHWWCDAIEEIHQMFCFTMSRPHTSSNIRRSSRPNHTFVQSRRSTASAITFLRRLARRIDRSLIRHQSVVALWQGAAHWLNAELASSYNALSPGRRMQRNAISIRHEYKE